jgi:mannosyl-oligosaccharide glucosidase
MVRVSVHQGLLLGLCALVANVGAQVAEIEKASNDSLLWGPYRPNLYFGVRPRIPKSLMGGLMWTRVEDYESVQNSEHLQIHDIACIMAD